MKFIKLKTMKYQGNIGDTVMKEVYINADNINVAEVAENKSKVLFQMVSDPSRYIITDEKSIKTFIDMMNNK